MEYEVYEPTEGSLNSSLSKIPPAMTHMFMQPVGIRRSQSAFPAPILDMDKLLDL